MTFRRPGVNWESQNPSGSFLVSVLSTIEICLFIYICLTTQWMVSLILALKCKAHLAMTTEELRIFTIFVPFSYTACSWNHTCTFFVVRTHLCILVNTSCMFIMYVLNVSIQVYESICLSFYLFSISALMDILMLIM